MSVSVYVADAALLTGAATTQGAAVPALTKRTIRAATLTNTTAAAIAATVYMVPAGGAAGPANTLISGRSIAPGESYPCPELINQGLGAAGMLQALGAGLTFKFTAVDFI